MKQLCFENFSYFTDRKSVRFLVRLFPSFFFYCRFMIIVWLASLKAKRNSYDYEEWNDSSFDVLKLLESSGVEFISIAGRKGGSTVAVAIVNALLIMAGEQLEGSKVKAACE